MQNIIPDERYSVADEAILGAFFKLLKEKKPDRITVSDITKTAGIARSTFYNHYQDIPSLISAVEDKTIHDVFSMMENFQPKNDRDMQFLFSDSVPVHYGKSFSVRSFEHASWQ